MVIALLLFTCFLTILLLSQGVLPLAVTDIQLQTKNKKDAYVLHGESAILSCHYQLGPEEVLTSVLWLKDDIEVYHWRNNLTPVSSASFHGRVDLSNKSPITIIITKASMDMYGTITCRVTASNKVAEYNMFQLVVIVDACKDGSFETYTDMIKCTETITMRCVGMFPKPSPECAIINELTQTYIKSVPLDQVKRLKNGTFEITLSRLFTIEEYINYTDISISCNIVVQDTSWRKGIKHRLFGDRGCRVNPPSVSDGYFNLTEGRTCWNDPHDGVEAVYVCKSGFQLRGSEIMICRNGSWIPQSSNELSIHSIPLCSTGNRFSSKIKYIFSMLLMNLLLLSIMA